MSDNVNSVWSGGRSATTTTPLDADQWMELYLAGFTVAEVIAKNGCKHDPHWSAPEMHAFLESLEDHVLDQVALQSDVVGQYEQDAVREGARQGYLNYVKNGKEGKDAPINLHVSGSGSVSERVHFSNQVGGEVPDQDDPGSGQERLFHLGLGSGTAGPPIEKASGHPAHDEARTATTSEQSEIHPQETTRMLSALITLGHACQELAREVAHPDSRVGRRLAAEVAWVTAWRECKAAYLSLDRWGGDDD